MQFLLITQDPELLLQPIEQGVSQFPGPFQEGTELLVLMDKIIDMDHHPTAAPNHSWNHISKL